MSEEKTILVVEDEPGMQDMIQMRLESAGHSITIANNGREGLDKVKEILPDLIITDVLMPEMDGFAFYKKLKESSISSDIPVLVLTARGKMEDSFKVIGADDFVAKPFKGEELLERVNNLLKKKRAPKRNIQNLKVLIGGEESEITKNIETLLKKEGCIPDLVTTGDQAIGKIAISPPGLIVLDVHMKVMPSFEIVKTLKEMPEMKQIPIMMYSHYDLTQLDNQEVRSKALGVDDALEKCHKLGGIEYIGYYHEAVFLDFIKKFLGNK